MQKIYRPSVVVPWARTLLIVPAFIFVLGFFGWIASLVLGFRYGDFHVHLNPFQKVVGEGFQLSGMLLLVWIFRRYVDRESFRSLGFDLRGIGIESAAGIGLGALIMAAGFTALIFMHEIQWVGFGMDFSNLMMGFCLFVMVSITEELFLRGYILNNLMESMHPMAALMGSSVFFSLLHVFNANFSWLAFWNILLAGVLLGLPYVYTKRLWLSFGLHFGWNFFQGTIFGFNVSGTVTQSLFTQSRTSDTVWNGGAFGFEGSVLSIVFQLIAIFGMWFYFSKREKTAAAEMVTPENTLQAETMD